MIETIKHLLLRFSCLFYTNRRCVQPRYCQQMAPEDWLSPDKCEDCEPPDAEIQGPQRWRRKVDDARV